MRKTFFISIIIGLSVLFSCSDRDDSIENNIIIPEGKAKNIVDLDASKEGAWTYFSFTKGEIVSITNPEKDLSWDIAFSRYHIRTNGGTSGMGKGEVARLEEKDFTRVVSIPTDAVFVKDTLVKPQVRPGTPEKPAISMNDLISGNIMTPTGWWSYTPPASNSQAPKFELNYWVYIVKDANGVPVKIQLTGYKNSKTANTGFITFRYERMQ